jgi:hypothetical protein
MMFVVVVVLFAFFGGVSAGGNAVHAYDGVSEKIVSLEKPNLRESPLTSAVTLKKGYSSDEDGYVYIHYYPTNNCTGDAFSYHVHAVDVCVKSGSTSSRYTCNSGL